MRQRYAFVCCFLFVALSIQSSKLVRSVMFIVFLGFICKHVFLDKVQLAEYSTFSEENLTGCRTRPIQRLCKEDAFKRNENRKKLHMGLFGPVGNELFRSVRNTSFSNITYKRLRWSRRSVLAFGTQVRGFKPGRSRRIFQGEKIRKRSKAVCPMSLICGM